jgi:hypothetical protein
MRAAVMGIAVLVQLPPERVIDPEIVPADGVATPVSRRLPEESGALRVRVLEESRVPLTAISGASERHPLR